MANAIKWSALGTFSTAIPGDATNGLRNRANGATVLGTEIDNSTDKNMYADFQLKVNLGTAPTGPCLCHIVQCLDGTNYEDGSTGAPGTIPAKLPAFTFPLRAAIGQQVITLSGIRIPPTKFKIEWVNNSGYTTTNANDTDNILQYRTYNEEIQ